MASSDASRDSELFELIASTFALIAAADGELADVEVARLGAWGRDQGFDDTSVQLLEERCRAFGRSLGHNAGRRRDELLARLKGLRDGGSRAALVLSAARVAVVADMRIDEAEEMVLHDIAEALGLDPDAV